MLAGSLAVTPLASLARYRAGVRKRTLIINLPGSAKAAKECLAFVTPAIPHAVDLLKSHDQSVASTHKQLQAGGERQLLTIVLLKR
jgi:molybdopterin adenylyltransferase